MMIMTDDVLLHHNVSMHLLHAVLDTFFKVLTWKFNQQSTAATVGDHFIYSRDFMFDSGVIKCGDT